MRLFLFTFLTALALPFLHGSSGASNELASPSPLEWSKKLARSEMARQGTALNFQGHPKAKWTYTSGLLALSLVQLGEATRDTSFRHFGEAVVSSYVVNDGSIRTYKLEEYNIDMIAPGRVLLHLWERTKDPRYRKAAELLRKQLSTHPRTSDGGFWHKQRYPHQMWLDGIYMGSPFYAQYAKTFGDPAAFEDVAKQILLMDKHAYDPAKGLHYHGWDEAKTQDWANKTTGTSPNFWGRAIGWYAMAIVDALEYLPPAQPELEAIQEVLRRVAEGIVRYQDKETGVWWQVMDMGGRTGNYLEATASSMFVYALSKAVNRGYLPRDKYLSVIQRGYAGILKQFIRTDAKGMVSLTRCCEVAGLGYGRDGSFEYYIREPIVDNDHKGVGPFILAGIEFEKLSKIDPLTQSTRVTGWESLPALLARIKAPSFPDRNFPIVDFGAKAGGADCTDAVHKAIDACNKAGGGRVVIPSGVWYTGAIHLKSGVNLHLTKDAVLKFLTDPAKFPVVFTRWEGVECMNFSPLIYAFDQENIAVTGPGTLDGQADWNNWWGWNDKKKASPTLQKKDRDQLVAWGEAGLPVEQRRFGPGHYLRPNFIQPYKCRNVLIEEVTILRSPMWEIHPVLCRNVTVRGVKIESHGPNNDGCDPESSIDVLIENCVFDTGDDCIAIKSGRNNDGRRVNVASENIIVRGCTMKDGHGGVVIGSEISGNCRNVFIEDCRMDSPNLDRALRFKSNAVRGGILENVFMRNVTVGRVAEAVLTIDLVYEEGANGGFPPTVRNVSVERVTSESSPRVMYIAGFPAATIDQIRFADCVFRGIETAEIVQYAGQIAFRNVAILPAKKPKSLNSVPAPGTKK